MKSEASFGERRHSSPGLVDSNRSESPTSYWCSLREQLTKRCSSPSRHEFTARFRPGKFPGLIASRSPSLSSMTGTLPTLTCQRAASSPTSAAVVRLTSSLNLRRIVLRVWWLDRKCGFPLSPPMEDRSTAAPGRAVRALQPRSLGGIPKHSAKLPSLRSLVRRPRACHGPGGLP